MKLKDKSALITGAAMGIGAAIARHFAKEGCKVVIADIEKDAGVATQKEIENQDGQCLFIECDVSKADSVKKMAQEQDPEQAMASWQPLSKMGMPQDVARAALYFASDDSEFATGSIFVIDGGLTSE